jgi:uncharacterized protein (DUF433 family)
MIFLKKLYRRMIQLFRKEYNYARGVRIPVIKRHVGEIWVSLWPKIKIEGSGIQVVFLTGMPRTGTSLAKNYLGDYPGLETIGFQRSGFVFAWRASKDTNDIVVDKATHYIRNLNKIRRTYGNQVAYCCLIRDPRDELVSLLETRKHREIRRDEKFWKQWARTYAGYLNFAKKTGDDSRCYLLRYEDLVRWPVAAKEDFLNWLELDLSAETITPEYRILNQNDIQDWKVEERKTISAKSVGRWKMEDDPERKELLAGWQNVSAATKLMQAMGYGDNGVEGLSCEFEGMSTFQSSSA